MRIGAPADCAAAGPAINAEALSATPATTMVRRIDNLGFMTPPRVCAGVLAPCVIRCGSFVPERDARRQLAVVLPASLGVIRQCESDRLVRLLVQMRDQSRGAREDRHAAH